jgi:hypothetical protein
MTPSQPRSTPQPLQLLFQSGRGCRLQAAILSLRRVKPSFHHKTVVLPGWNEAFSFLLFFVLFGSSGKPCGTFGEPKNRPSLPFRREDVSNVIVSSHRTCQLTPRQINQAHTSEGLGLIQKVAHPGPRRQTSVVITS